MAELYPLKKITTFGDWLTYGTDYVIGFGFFILIAIFSVFFTKTYNGRNFNSAFTSSMFITTLISFIFFWMDFVHPDVVGGTIVLTILGVISTFITKRAGA